MTWAEHWTLKIARAAKSQSLGFKRHADPIRSRSVLHAEQSCQALYSSRFGTSERGGRFHHFRFGGKVELDDMPRASAKFGYSDRMRADSLRAAQEQIGRELKTYYGPPRQIPHDMCVLLMQLKEQLTKLTVNRRQK